MHINIYVGLCVSLWVQARSAHQKMDLICIFFDITTHTQRYLRIYITCIYHVDKMIHMNHPWHGVLPCVARRKRTSEKTTATHKHTDTIINAGCECGGCKMVYMRSCKGAQHAKQSAGPICARKGKNREKYIHTYTFCIV